MSQRTTEPCKVAVYCRVAAKGQAHNAMEMQKKILRTYAEHLGDEIVAEVSDTESGTLIYRPGIQRLLELARNKEVKAVYAVDTSRIARNI